MERTQTGGKRILIIFLVLILCMSFSACSAENDTADRPPASEITDAHPESDSAGTQTVTEPDFTDEHPESDDAGAQTVTEPDIADERPESDDIGEQAAAVLTMEDFPELVPDILNLREKEYEDIPFLETQEQLSEYALWNLLCGRTEFECRISWDLSYNVSSVALEQACEAAMSYYLFSAYKPWDMITEDDGDPNSLYAKVKLVYDAPEFDLEARLSAWSYVVNNPPPEGGFSDYAEEMEYARNVHDYVACKVTYDPMGYNPELLLGMTRYDDLQEAYNVLGKNQNTAVCAAYARAFALICQYAGINCAWVWGNETEESSHAWNVIYPCDGSEPVLVDVTWDDGLSVDTAGQTDVDDSYFYIPLSVEYEHEADENMADFLQYINEAASG